MYTPVIELKRRHLISKYWLVNRRPHPSLTVAKNLRIRTRTG